MRIAISILAALFGLLHTVAAAAQFRSKDLAARNRAISMACGGICAMCMAAAHLVGHNPPWVDVIGTAAGCLLICHAAYENGRRSGNLHPAHHIVRGAVAALLVVGVAIW